MPLVSANTHQKWRRGHQEERDEAGGASEPREDVDGRGDRVQLVDANDTIEKVVEQALAICLERSSACF